MNLIFNVVKRNTNTRSHSLRGLQLEPGPCASQW